MVYQFYQKNPFFLLRLFLTIMKHLISILCFSLFIIGAVAAQQPHFVYLQTDNNQPFYVLLKNKNYSSSSIGYVILPKLENGDYRIKIGFAKSDMPEQDYVLKIKDNDQGYLIKNFGEKGSGIFNLQTLAIQYSGEAGRQLDAATNAQRETERQKILLRQQKDSTEKAEAAAAEQRRIDNEAKLVAAAAKQKEDAIAQEKQRTEDSIKAENAATIAATNQKKGAAALAKQQSLDSIKNANANKLAIAKQKKEAAALANQQRIDSIKAVNASKIAAVRAKILAKHEADSIAKANAPQAVVKAQPKTAETLAQKKARLATEAAVKKQANVARAQQTADSINAVEQAKIAAGEQQRVNDSILAKQKVDEQTEIAAQRKASEIAMQQKAAEALQRKKDSLAMVEQNKVQAEQATAANASKDSSMLVAKTNTDQSTSKNVNAAIVYEPQVLNRLATDSGTLMTYKIPSNKGWDTVTAFIKGSPTEKKEVTDTKNVTTDANNPPQSNGVKFLDMHFKQDSANKSNDLITPVFKEDKPAKSTTTQEEVTPTKNAVSNSAIAATASIGNSNCRTEANDKDFYALRKKMVAQNDADDMIMVAKKSMREKCYNTLQIRNLSALLITDADRYQFLEAAYPFASDAYNYGSLADLLKDNYYGERFKVMLKR